jgi:cellulose synthase/poly-beta-1,6-N-acetylglucosamine synthase-like glycosyltransferase
MVEDYELIHRLHRHSHDHGLGWHVAVVGGALARTDAPASIRGFLKQRQRWFGGFLPTTAFAMVAATGNIYFGLWYPVVVAAATAVIGWLFVKEMRGSDIDA